MALKGNNIKEVVVKKNLKGNVECENHIEGAEKIVGEEKIGGGNIVEKTVADNTGESLIITPK